MGNGKGRFIHNNDDVCEKTWVNNKAEGYDIYTHSDGVQHKRKMIKKHGRGIEAQSDGATYDGGYEDGNKCEVGHFRWPDGSKCKGEFYRNNIHGKGIYTWIDGRKFDGE